MKILFTLMMVVIVISIASMAWAEKTSFGLGVGAQDGDIGFQLRKDYWLGGDISAITGQASVFLHNKTTFKVDADYHFVLNPENNGRFYPLLGLQFAFNSDNAKFGINAGGGFNFMLTQSTAAFVEAKFVFGKWDGFAIMGGIYF